MILINVSSNVAMKMAIVAGIKSSIFIITDEGNRGVGKGWHIGLCLVCLLHADYASGVGSTSSAMKFDSV